MEAQLEQLLVQEQTLALVLPQLVRLEVELLIVFSILMQLVLQVESAY